MELASGFIFSEVECENRTYQTWWAQVSSGLTKGNGIVGVSQRWGKRSINQSCGLGCPICRYVPSPVCLEQIRGACNCPSTGATAKNAPRLTRETQNALISAAIRCQPKSQYYKPNRTNWKSTVKTISKQIYTPKLFTADPQHGESQFGFSSPSSLQSILANVERLGQTYAPTLAAA